jgi:hypothetical protein
VLLLNPDTEIVGDCISQLASYMQRQPEVGVVGPRLLNPDGSTQPNRRRWPSPLTAVFESTPLEWHWPDNRFARRYRCADLADDQPGAVDWITGAAMLVRGTAVEQVGGLDEGYFMYSEELDWCRRFSAAGWAVHYLPAARVIHHEAGSSSQVVGLRNVYFYRSRLRYLRAYHGMASAQAVRAALMAAFGVDLMLEAAKWGVGHKRRLRQARMRAYGLLLRDLALARPGAGLAYPRGRLGPAAREPASVKTVEPHG